MGDTVALLDLRVLPCFNTEDIGIVAFMGPCFMEFGELFGIFDGVTCPVWPDILWTAICKFVEIISIYLISDMMPTLVISFI